MRDRQGNDAAPGLFYPQHGVTKIILQNEVGNRTIGLVGLYDPIEKAGSDDAAAAPDRCDLAQAQIDPYDCKTASARDAACSSRERHRFFSR
jgi:hypothetical protein